MREAIGLRADGGSNAGLGKRARAFRIRARPQAAFQNQEAEAEGDDSAHAKAMTRPSNKPWLVKSQCGRAWNGSRGRRERGPERVRALAAAAVSDHAARRREAHAVLVVAARQARRVSWVRHFIHHFQVGPGPAAAIAFRAGK